MPRCLPREPEAKRWVFTWNNYGAEDFAALKVVIGEYCSYSVVGEERGANGTPHLQGYLHCADKYRLTALKDRFSRSAHFAVARGSAHSNKVYCTKDGVYWEHGVCPGKPPSKSRDELAREWKGAFAGGRAGLELFGESNPGVYLWSRHTLLRNSLSSAAPVVRPDIRVEWIYGRPGVGKSRLAHARLPDAFVKDPLTKWWTGYLLETSCIIDDFGKCGIGLNHLLRWFDRYKCWVETKGDLVPLLVVEFLVTSNFHPAECFVNVDGSVHDQIAALERRMTVTEMV